MSLRHVKLQGGAVAVWVNRLLRLLLWQADEHGFDPWLPHPIPSSIFLWYNLSLIYHFHEDVCVNGRKSCFSEGARLVLPEEAKL